MEYQLRLKTDELKMVTNKIDKTSADINDVIRNLETINNSISSSWNDENSKLFMDNFGAYIRDLYGITRFYNDITTRVNKLVENYETTDLELSKKVTIDTKK